ncbi:8134_t:CDS:2 [Entrophospora sp. SA101]|nr:8134_t:CDS:2 [Entrophospora sp. SA101]
MPQSKKVKIGLINPLIKTRLGLIKTGILNKIEDEDYEKNNADASTSEDSDYVIKDEKYYDDDHENRNQYAADAIYNQNFMQITKEEYGNGSSNNVGC